MVSERAGLRAPFSSQTCGSEVAVAGHLDIAAAAVTLPPWHATRPKPLRAGHSTQRAGTYATPTHGQPTAVLLQAPTFLANPRQQPPYAMVQPTAGPPAPTIPVPSPDKPLHGAAGKPLHASRRPHHITGSSLSATRQTLQTSGQSLLASGKHLLRASGKTHTGVPLHLSGIPRPSARFALHATGPYLHVQTPPPLAGSATLFGSIPAILAANNLIGTYPPRAAPPASPCTISLAPSIKTAPHAALLQGNPQRILHIPCANAQIPNYPVVGVPAALAYGTPVTCAPTPLSTDDILIIQTFLGNLAKASTHHPSVDGGYFNTNKDDAVNEALLLTFSQLLTVGVTSGADTPQTPLRADGSSTGAAYNPAALAVADTSLVVTSSHALQGSATILVSGHLADDSLAAQVDASVTYSAWNNLVLPAGIVEAQPFRICRHSECSDLFPAAIYNATRGTAILSSAHLLQGGNTTVLTAHTAHAAPLTANVVPLLHLPFDPGGHDHHGEQVESQIQPSPLGYTPSTPLVANFTLSSPKALVFIKKMLAALFLLILLDYQPCNNSASTSNMTLNHHLMLSSRLRGRMSHVQAHESIITKLLDLHGQAKEKRTNGINIHFLFSYGFNIDPG